MRPWSVCEPCVWPWGCVLRRRTAALTVAPAKLSESVLQRLTYEVADALEEQVPAKWLWFGHHVKAADGSTLMTPDTEANQAAWPQMAAQQPGWGSPFCVS